MLAQIQSLCMENSFDILRIYYILNVFCRMQFEKTLVVINNCQTQTSYYAIINVGLNWKQSITMKSTITCYLIKTTWSNVFYKILYKSLLYKTKLIWLNKRFMPKYCINFIVIIWNYLRISYHTHTALYENNSNLTYYRNCSTIILVIKKFR